MPPAYPFATCRPLSRTLSRPSSVPSFPPSRLVRDVRAAGGAGGGGRAGCIRGHPLRALPDRGKAATALRSLPRRRVLQRGMPGTAVRAHRPSGKYVGPDWRPVGALGRQQDDWDDHKEECTVLSRMDPSRRRPVDDVRLAWRVVRRQRRSPALVRGVYKLPRCASPIPVR